ncbi:phosphatase PAP2 family protein [Yimella sp. cx-51]|uniref:phosphatase PAP2 family protein n=1 Tax=Yimella sp. cx-51 TaxID=2770551 RepID=UPI00165D554A|nr:phosphatase PAP2 family protein [Yimella sp. cx-51]MBC9957226.1 phosphatase PAP2 family protein [Yimella sp. cx-51]QTH37129.1 phosphatase PAP2 family protein [Yimella sp. cx-51]
MKHTELEVHEEQAWHPPVHLLRRMVIAGALISLVALGLGWVLTARGSARTGELDVSVWVTQHRFEPLTSLSVFLDVAIQPLCVYVLMGLALLIFWVGGRGWDLVIEVIVFLGTWGATTLAKHAYDRVRPPDPPVDRIIALHDPNTMPSGHTAAAAALTAALTLTVWYARGSIRTALLIGVPFVLMVALSRIVVGAHYLGDVTVGILLSLGVSLLIIALLIRVGLIDPIQDAGSRPLSPSWPPAPRCR